MLQISVHKRQSDFNFDVNITCQDRVMGLFGPSGSGKTTLLNCLAGVTSPDSGRLRLGSEVWFDTKQRVDVPARRRCVGYVFQDSLLFDHMSVLKNILYGHQPDRDGQTLHHVVEVLEIGDLLPRRPEELSGGQRRRVAIARALLRNPRLLLFDEPFSGLDAALAGRILVYLKRVLETFQVPAVYVSHSINDIVYLCDEAVVLHDGQVVAQGPPTSIMTRHGVLTDRHMMELQSIFTARLLEKRGDDSSIRCRVGEEELILYGMLGGKCEVLTLAIHASDIILALERPQGISARNTLPAVVESVEPVGPRILVMINVGTRWMVEVGRAAVDELKLRPGARVFAIVKATAIRIL